LFAHNATLFKKPGDPYFKQTVFLSMLNMMELEKAD